MKNLQKLFLAATIGTLIIGIISSLPSYAIMSGINTLVSYNSTNTAPSGGAGNTVVHISEDGNIVVWSSQSHDIVTNDTSIGNQLYKRNLQTGATSIVSASSGGAASGSTVNEFAISRTGRYIAFSAIRTDVVASPVVTAINRNHLYIRDTALGMTTMVDVNSSGVPANLTDGASSRAVGVSDDGRFVTFSSNATNLLNFGNPIGITESYYVKDMQTGQVVNPTASNAGVRANANTYYVKTSCDGSLSVFSTNATNLTPQDNGNTNTYLVDLRNGYSISNLTYNADHGAVPVSISCNGRYVILSSNSTNLTSDSVSGSNKHLFRYDRLSGEYSLVDKSTSGYIPSSIQTSSGPMFGGTNVSDNGRVAFFGYDSNLVSPAAASYLELYIRNPEAGTTELVPVDSSGVERGLGSTNTQVLHGLEISADGKSVVYNSIATNLIPGIGSGGGKKLVLSKVE